MKEFKYQSICSILGVFCLFFGFASVLGEELLDNSRSCGHRPLCKKYPVLCQGFKSRLLDGFLPGELPFIAKLNIGESFLHENASEQCVAAILSDQDLILNAKCILVYDNGTISTIDNNFWNRNYSTKQTPKTFVQLSNYITHLFSNELTLITLPKKSETYLSDLIQPSCVSSVIDKFELNGVACGFSKKKHKKELELACRLVTFSNKGESDKKNLKLDNQIFDDLKVGAAIFRRQYDNDEKWTLVGFTNSNNSISTLSENDCKVLKRKTFGRVTCDASNTGDANDANNVSNASNADDVDDVGNADDADDADDAGNAGDAGDANDVNDADNADDASNADVQSADTSSPNHNRPKCHHCGDNKKTENNKKIEKFSTYFKVLPVLNVSENQPIATENNESSNPNDTSSMIPLITFGVILFLGMILSIIAAQKARSSGSYQEL